MSKGEVLSKNNSKKIQALKRSQEIENILKKGIMESEALQNSGDDRPEDESHINELLENNKKYKEGSAKNKKTSGKGTKKK